MIKVENIGSSNQDTGLLFLQSAALEISANAVIIINTDSVIIWANPAFERLTGYSLDEAVGKDHMDLIRSGLLNPSFYHALWKTMKVRQMWSGEFMNSCKNGMIYTVAMTIKPASYEIGIHDHLIVVMEDISLRRRLEQRHSAQANLLEKARDNEPLTVLLEEMIQFIESQAPNLRCSILLADRERGVLCNSVAPSLPDDFNRLVEGLPIAEGYGSCGTACARGQPVFVADVRNDPLWASYIPMLSDQDWLQACWSTPFFDSQGRLLGTFGVYAPQPRTPHPEESEIIAYAVSLASLLVERKQIESELHEKEFLLSESQRLAHLGSWQFNVFTGSLSWTEETYRLFGMSPTLFTPNLDSFYEVIYVDDRSSMQQWVSACAAGEHPNDLEFRVVLQDGSIRFLRGRGDMQYTPSNNPIRMVGTVQDITSYKEAELRLLNLNRVYTILSNINQLIVRSRNIDILLSESCRIAVADGGFRMAWIGLPNLSFGELRPVAHWGGNQEYLEHLHIPLTGGAYGSGPTGTAYREGRHVYCNDIAHEPCMEPWRARALAHGYNSSIALPLIVRGVVRGVFNLYSSQTAFFNDEEVKLLNELATDIAFAMEVSEIEIERQQNEHRLRQAAAVFESTREGVMLTDDKLFVRLVNRAFTEITGYSEQEILGKKATLLSSGRHNRDFYRDILFSIRAAGHWQGEIWNRRKNGEVFPELLSISTVKDEYDRVTGYAGVFADITKIKASEATLEFLAHHDPLTRLPNRLLLLSRLEHSIGKALRENRQLALLMLDLDRFKDINDSFGHLSGDDLLQQAAARLTSRLRDIDTVSRLGGDEFTVLLDEIVHPEDAARVAETIIFALGEPWKLANGVEVRIGASVGISLFPQHGSSAEELLQHADAALYKAKAEGGNRFTYFSHVFTVAARERIELEARLRRAISENELRVYYQPQVDIGTGFIIGAEALVRWEDNEQGLIPPNCFIPVAETTGLINAIGEWVLKETCQQGQRWLEKGLPPLSLAVNVSPHQFLTSNLVEVVANTLALTGFPASHLELEVTESALLEKQKESVDSLNRLRSIGVRLAIDDFGTGYSSLAYLKRFPLDVIKIDKSFIDDLPDSQDDQEIIAAIIGMAHTLRFKVLAEGVENVEQLAFLQSKGCNYYQGYLKSPPLPADMFESLLMGSDKLKKL